MKRYKMKVTPEQSRAVQEACFAQGIEWRLGAEVMFTDEPYLIIGTEIRFKSCMECFLNAPAEGISPEGFIAMLNDNPKGHPHAELMAQYAQDAAETDKPWERWEYYSNTLERWATCIGHLQWADDVLYRRKPDTIKVGKHEFPRPMTVIPESGTCYWCLDMTTRGFEVIKGRWEGDTIDNLRHEAGLCHLSKEAAEQHAAVLNAINRGDVE